MIQLSASHTHSAAQPWTRGEVWSSPAVQSSTPLMPLSTSLDWPPDSRQSFHMLGAPIRANTPHNKNVLGGVECFDC
jgi:hypothetical protein